MTTERGDEERLSTADLAEPRGERDARPAPDEAEELELEGRSEHDDGEPLFDKSESARFQQDWDSIQTGFVDEPRRAVERADALVADLMQRLAASFADERGRLEAQWDRGDDVSTEDLRVALQRYRSFFGRLLHA